MSTTKESIKKIAVWDREDVPTFEQSGKLDHDYMDALLRASKASNSAEIKAKCRDRFVEHVKVVLD